MDRYAMCVVTREFFYIQMEKYARQALSDGLKNVSELVVSKDDEVYRVLVLHYNRNNQIEASVTRNRRPAITELEVDGCRDVTTNQRTFNISTCGLEAVIYLY